MNTTLLSLLTRGLQMSSDELAGIVPLVSVFSALFSHVLTLMHDVEFFDDQPTSQSTLPRSSLSSDTMRDFNPFTPTVALSVQQQSILCMTGLSLRL